MDNRACYIQDILRVYTGKKNGAYKRILPEELTAHLLNTIKKRNSIVEPKEIILANSIGTQGNPARNTHLRSIYNQDISSFTVDAQCGGFYKALELAYFKAICTSTSVIAGGMESNSLMPTRYYHKNDPRYIGETPFFYAEFSNKQSGSLINAAANLALEYKITHNEMWAWTKASHQKAKKSFECALFEKHVINFENMNLGFDETLKNNLEALDEKVGRSKEIIDASNTADLHDGAGLCLLSLEKTNETLAAIKHITFVGLSPDEAPKGAINSTEKLLQEKGIAISDIELFEINESFAVKPLAFAKHFKVDHQKINILGGNLAMGHPYASSGVINLINLILSLKLQKKRRGLLTAGIAGGLGVSLLIEL